MVPADVTTSEQAIARRQQPNAITPQAFDRLLATIHAKAACNTDGADKRLIILRDAPGQNNWPRITHQAGVAANLMHAMADRTEKGPVNFIIDSPDHLWLDDNRLLSRDGRVETIDAAQLDLLVAKLAQELKEYALREYGGSVMRQTGSAPYASALTQAIEDATPLMDNLDQSSGPLEGQYVIHICNTLLGKEPSELEDGLYRIKLDSDVVRAMGEQTHFAFAFQGGDIPDQLSFQIAADHENADELSVGMYLWGSTYVKLPTSIARNMLRLDRLQSMPQDSGGEIVGLTLSEQEKDAARTVHSKLTG